MPPVAIEVRNAQGQPITAGKVAVCPEDGPCQDFPLSADGQVRIDSKLLLIPDLTIVVHDTARGIRLVASGWNLTRAQRWEAENRPSSLRGLLRGTPELGLDLTFTHDEGARPRMGEKPSRWYLVGGAVFLGGENFRSDTGALESGVTLESGWGVMLGRRSGIPRGWTEDVGRRSYFDFTLSYAQNRYLLGADQEFGTRDLTFHRATLALGPGWAWGDTRLSLQALVGLGVVLDGSEVLERLGRRYSMPAAGVGVRFSRLLFGVGVGRLGLCLGGSALYHAGDELDNDHWYGLAPAALLGLTLE